ncbi:hypothetical protein K8R78_05880 [bacterium]|nr:hypothetical protein [bacterium]
MKKSPLPVAALTLALASLLAAANYLLAVFFVMHLEPWLWSTLAGVLTLAALVHLFIKAKRDEDGKVFGRALGGLLNLGETRSALTPAAWVLWGGTILISFREQLPYIIWPIATLLLGGIALVFALKQKKGRSVSIIALALGLLIFVGHLLIGYIAAEVNEASEQQLRNEIDAMIDAEMEDL